MKHITFLLANFLFLHLSDLHSQTINFEKNKLQPVNVSMSVEKLMSKQVVKVIKDSSITAADRPCFVKIEGVILKTALLKWMC